MSGPICPDCSSFEIIHVSKSKDKCEFCGWQGEKLPRKILASKHMKSLGESQRKHKKEREEGKLYFFRIYCDSDEAYDAVADHIDEKYHLSDSYVYTERYLLFRLSSKPSEEIMKEIKALDAVKKTSIF